MRSAWLAAFLGVTSGGSLWAKGTSELLYTEPFDLAAGGTTLTRASQEGIVFANPALLPLGAATIRWVGLQTGVMIDRDLAASGARLDEATSEASDQDLIGRLFDQSLHFGQTTTVSFLNKNFAVTAFNRFELDIEGRRYGNFGLPTIDIGVEAYAGALASFAARPRRWLSLGVTGKQLYIAEPSLTIPLTDQNYVRDVIEDPSSLRDSIRIGEGLGADLGILLLWQNHHVDLSLGLKLEDLGDTQLSQDVGTIPQTAHAGLGLALHGTTEVLHLSLDYRDLLGAYAEERSFKKIYVGARLMIRQMLGLAIGLYQGIPTFGIRMDFFIFKLGVTAYGRELGDFPGERQREMVMVYTSLGF